ncbi:MAG: Hsp70 family protein [bacterium]|nr:Hsp70 family protein [bacterium]
MKLGIDFGTTHTVAALADQGNFPVVHFATADGDWFDYFPSLIAVKEGEARFGFEAFDLLEAPDWTIIRSIKTLIKHIHTHEELEISGHQYPVMKLLIDFFAAFKEALIHQSSIEGLGLQSFTVSAAVPANTNNTQRFLTHEAFIGGGFDVINMLNEPSAATMEYTNSHFKNVGLSNKKYLLVYDLGGGTFDASIAEIHDRHHQIIATEGLEDLGGDQFDEILCEMILEQFDPRPELDYGQQVGLLELCREKKESLTPHSRTLLIEWAPQGQASEVLRLDVKDYFERCEPLVERTVEVVERLVKRVSGTEGIEEFTAIYLVGGMSNFPLVARKLKQIYSQNKVRKSHHCDSAVAIGLAILSDADNDQFVLKESLTRYFGLWREGDKGESLVFDNIFEKDQALPAKNEPPLVLRRRYRPSHNIGRFRFQECSQFEADRPAGLVTVWSQIDFPFDPRLQGTDLTAMEVMRYDEPLNYEVEEIFSLDHQGEISFKVINHVNGYTQSFQLSRMNGIE